MSILTQAHLDELPGKLSNINDTMEEIQLLVDSSSKDPEGYLNLIDALQENLNDLRTDIESAN